MRADIRTSNLIKYTEYEVFPHSFLEYIYNVRNERCFHIQNNQTETIRKEILYSVIRVSNNKWIS